MRTGPAGTVQRTDDRMAPYSSRGPSAVDFEAKPDVVVHQLTALPSAPDLRQKGIYEATDRLRRAYPQAHPRA